MKLWLDLNNENDVNENKMGNDLVSHYDREDKQ